MRGKLIKTAAQLSSVRITPAYAGKTFVYLSFAAMTEDHPRVCGENPPVAHFCNERCGSPPRMRGKLCTISRSSSCRRITPAYAGKTVRFAVAQPAVPDHPRVCGENDHKDEDPALTGGSPPRMRGKRPAVGICCCVVRITPAYAGKTAYQTVMFSGNTDHPRVCGENSGILNHATSCRGSPPRMRGKRLVAAAHRTTAGITPAYAGKTGRQAVQRPYSKGSPPRMRGKQA